MDKFEEMRAFVAVVEAGSFVGAAEALQVSKTAVSRLVGDLEQRLGARLMQRTTRRLSLTEEGERFHERCRELLDGIAQAEAELTERTGRAIGPLRLNVPVSFGLLHLAPLWPGFMARHPQVLLEVTLSDRLVDLVDEGIDLAVRIARLPSSSLISRQLTTTRMVLCASPEYLRREGEPAHPADLAQHSVMAYSWWSGGDEWRFEDAQGKPHSVVTRPRLRANSGDTCRAAALADQGVIYQPQFLVGEDLRAGRLVPVLPALHGPAIGIHVVYPSRKHLAGKVRAMVDFLGAAFQTPAWG